MTAPALHAGPPPRPGTPRRRPRQARRDGRRARDRRRRRWTKYRRTPPGARGKPDRPRTHRGPGRSGLAVLELCPLSPVRQRVPGGRQPGHRIGVVEGVECVLVANDPTVKGGTSNPWTLRKILRTQPDRTGESPVIAGGVRRRGSADAEGDLHPRRPDVRDLTRLSAQSSDHRGGVRQLQPAAPGIPGMSDHVVMIKDRSKGVPGRPAAGEDGHR